MRPASPSYTLPPLAIPNPHSGSGTARFFPFDGSDFDSESDDDLWLPAPAANAHAVPRLPPLFISALGEAPDARHSTLRARAMAAARDVEAIGAFGFCRTVYQKSAKEIALFLFSS
jgi:hypothetical protein